MRREKFFHGFVYAFSGFVAAVRQERNMRFHLCAACYVYFFSLFYDFGKVEYAVITGLVCGVLALEMLNSSLERCVERPSPDRYMTAGIVKDMAAGAVLVFCIGAAVCGVLLFGDIKVMRGILSFFIQTPLAMVCFAVSLLASAWFIFGKEDK